MSVSGASFVLAWMVDYRFCTTVVERQIEVSTTLEAVALIELYKLENFCREWLRGVMRTARRGEVDLGEGARSKAGRPRN
jgi:hypothetical protein